MVPSTPPPATEAAIHTLAQGLGFALVGVAPPHPSPHRDYVLKWLAAGHHGEMHYLAKNVATRLDPCQFLPGAEAVIVVADRHPSESSQDAPSLSEVAGNSRPTSGSGRIARYAWGNDYHVIIKRRLALLLDALEQSWPQHQYRSCVDTAPTLEREHAQRAGIGWIGKHTLIIHPQLGSWLLLGQIVTTLPIELASKDNSVTTDHCGNCTRCIDACPTQCIDKAGYRIDADRCVSYLTIEHRAIIISDLHPHMGDWIAGCDVCQEVCPFNRPPREATEPTHPSYTMRPPSPSIDLLTVLNWNTADRRDAVQRSALKRIKLDQFKRNAVIAGGNYLVEHAHAPLRRRIEQLAEEANESDIVRNTAKQILDRLKRIANSK